MSEDLSQYTSRVQRGDDGVYRWHYDMDMIRNRSMLYTLLKANCLILLAVTAAGSLLIAWMEGGFDAPMARGVALIGLMAQYSGFDTELIRKAIEISVPAKFLDVNLKAFELGLNYSKR